MYRHFESFSTRNDLAVIRPRIPGAKIRSVSPLRDPIRQRGANIWLRQLSLFNAAPARYPM
jgi:hypothetical protein